MSPVDLEFRFVGAPRIGGTPYVDDFVITGISRAAAMVSLEAGPPSLGRSGKTGICCGRASGIIYLVPSSCFC